MDREAPVATRVSGLVPALLQIAGFLGFCASVVVTIAVDERELLALGGLCASVACGGYVVQARRNGKAPA